MAEDVTVVSEAFGVEPVLVSGSGDAAKRLAALAAENGASLIVIGSRGRTGLMALGSVSERVVHRARCSVLVARPPEPASP